MARNRMPEVVDAFRVIETEEMEKRLMEFVHHSVLLSNSQRLILLISPFRLVR
jgi:hypothetical protein